MIFTENPVKILKLKQTSQMLPTLFQVHEYLYCSFYYP